MELIKEIESRRDAHGYIRRWGKFKCIICLQEIEKRLEIGLRDQSCGCNKDEHKTKHGGYYTKLYKVWVSMKQRILNPTTKFYKDYGGRGITICPEWTESYIVFRDWSLSNGYQEGLEIDRKDTNGNYEPSNCRWVTHKENMRNRRNNKLSLEKANEIRALYNSGYYTQKQLAEKYNVSRRLIGNIINSKIWKI